jgi:hypothetical protein
MKIESSGDGLDSTPNQTKKAHPFGMSLIVLLGENGN